MTRSRELCIEIREIDDDVLMIETNDAGGPPVLWLERSIDPEPWVFLLQSPDASVFCAAVAEAVSDQVANAEDKLAQAVEVLQPLLDFALDSVDEVNPPTRKAVEKDIMAARAFLATIQPEGGTE